MTRWEELGMTAEEKVKAKWPDAYCLSRRDYEDGTDSYAVYDGIGSPDLKVSGWREDEETAWADAAKRLEEN